MTISPDAKDSQQNPARDSPAERMKRAACEIRLLAMEAPPGPWRSIVSAEVPPHVKRTWFDGEGRRCHRLVTEEVDGMGAAEHIAAWSPVQATAVADLLDSLAVGIETRGVTARLKLSERAAVVLADLIVTCGRER